MTKLKPCPFCGSDAQIYNGDSMGRSIFIMCKKCQCGTSRETLEHAIEDWNRRVEQKSCLNAYWLGEKRRENE